MVKTGVSRILIEGPDCSGKSTLINRIKNKLHWDAKLLHHINGDQFERYLKEYASQNTVFGRGHISEIVYGKMWRNGNSFSVKEKELLDEFIKQKMLVIFVCPKLKTIKERYLKRNDDQQIKFNELRKSRDLFVKEFKNKKYILYEAKNYKELEIVLKKISEAIS